jgi:hypothetical protein
MIVLHSSNLSAARATIEAFERGDSQCASNVVSVWYSGAIVAVKSFDGKYFMLGFSIVVEPREKRLIETEHLPESIFKKTIILIYCFNSIVYRVYVI